MAATSTTAPYQLVSSSYSLTRTILAFPTDQESLTEVGGWRNSETLWIDRGLSDSGRKFRAKKKFYGVSAFPFLLSCRDWLEFCKVQYCTLQIYYYSKSFTDVNGIQGKEKALNENLLEARKEKLHRQSRRLSLMLVSWWMEFKAKNTRIHWNLSRSRRTVSPTVSH